MRKLTDTQKLLQAIYIKYKCKSMDEAWQKYHQLYDDIELEPQEFITKPIPQRGKESMD